MTLVRALAALAAGGLLFALWCVRRALAGRQRAEAGYWAALDDRTHPWP